MLLLRIWLFLLLSTGLLTGSAYAQLSLNAFALTDATLIDAQHPHPLPHQTVLIKGNRIEAIFPDGSRPLGDSIMVFPLNGKFLIPGLIDTHVHMATDPSDVDNRASTLRVLSTMLHSGITSVRDMAGDARTLAGLSRDALTGDMLSPNIYYSALMAGPSFFDDPRTIATAKGGMAGQMPYMRAVTDSTNLVLAVAEAKGTGATGIKLYAQLSGPLAARIVAEAKRQGLLVWGHAWLSPAKPSDLIQAGIGSISHAPLLVRELLDSIPASWKKPGHPDKFWDDSIPATAALFQSMKEHDVILDATLTTYNKWGREDPAYQYNYEIAKTMTARAYKAGVKICAGTDDDQDSLVQREMHLLVKDAGFSPLDALIAATRNGAEALGISGKCGTIEVGKEADLVVLDRNPLDNIDHIKSVSLVIKGGRMVTLHPSGSTQAFPHRVTGDYFIPHFPFQNGSTSLQVLKLHYTTLGTPEKDKKGRVTNAVLILHGTGSQGSAFLGRAFAGELFGPGQLLDAAKYYIILPDGIGHGQSSKPSDSLHMKFPAYTYDDMVLACYRLLTEHLGVNHLRLVMGTSMGAMHSWMWGTTYPDFMDALLPLASLPAAIAGRNRMMRKMAIDLIKKDPAWKGGEYTAEPSLGLRGAGSSLFFMNSSPYHLQQRAPSREAAEEVLEGLEKGYQALDANDLIYQLEASRNYDPSPYLSRIKAPLFAINSADDEINPPELGILEKEIKKVPKGRYILLPITEETQGHGTNSLPAVWGDYLRELLQVSQ